VIETARCLAEIHGKQLEEVGRITSENFVKLFQVEP
jgi:Tat protein secretion system quality control protein TatD with DNase activity